MAALVLVLRIVASMPGQVPAAGAEVPPPEGQTVTAPRARAIGALRINGRAIADVPLAIQGADIFLPRVLLDRAGLHWVTAAIVDVAGEPYVSLATMVPRVQFSFDEHTAELQLDVPSESFSAATEITPTSRLQAADRSRPASAFLNYAVTVPQAVETRWGAELGVRAGQALLHTSASGVGTGVVSRGTTSITIDDERRLMRWEGGDTVAVSTLSGQALSIAGLTVSRELGINPEFFPYVPLLMTGATAVPATADVYVNGQLTARVPVDPGTFQVKDFALPVGGGNVRVVVRDDFGRVQELTRDYYRSPSLLRPGLQQFRYSAGAPLERAGGVDWRYGGFVALGEHRIGVFEALTLGASGGYARGSAFVGTSAAVRLPIGEIEIDVRGSRASGRNGTAMSATYLLRGWRLSAQGTARHFSSDYEEVRPRSAALDPVTDAGVSCSLLLGHGLSVGAQYLWWQGRSATRQETGTSLTARLPKNMSLTVIATRGTSVSRASSLVATLTAPLGRRSSASVVRQSASSMADETRVSMQRSLPLGPGLGYQVQWQDGRATDRSAVVQYQNGWARMEARQDFWAGRSAASFNLSGAVVALREGVFLSRPITDAFALVRVPGVRGVRAYSSNQLVGRTNRRGDVVVPTLGSYQSNRVSINDGDLPMFVETERVESVLAPGLRGAGVAVFAVREADRSEDDVLKRLEAMESGVSGVGGSGGSGGGGTLTVAHWPARLFALGGAVRR